MLLFSFHLGFIFLQQKKAVACLFSSSSGIIRPDGKIIKNAKVIRTIDEADKFVDETTTDENGYFEFPSSFRRSLLHILPHEFAVGQMIIVIVDGKEYDIWSGVKRSRIEHGEGRGVLIYLECELLNEKKFITVNGQTFYSLCKWEVDEDQPEDIF